MSAPKMSAEEMKRYYAQVHRYAIALDPLDDLSAVTDVTANPWVNRFTDYAHRLGMERVFQMLSAEWGLLDGRSVLDLGCGRGRWSKLYASRGAAVTGVDISPDAIAMLKREMPKHNFICEDIVSLKFPRESFDLVNSVTVLQHLPDAQQQAALGLAALWVKSGGYLVLLENIVGFNAAHVFAHRTEEWIRMGEATGLKCCYSQKCNFELLLRAEARVLKWLRGSGHSDDCSDLPPAASPVRQSPNSQLRSAGKALLAQLSFPVEWLCYRVPVVAPTHSVMIFNKTSAAGDGGQEVSNG